MVAEVYWMTVPDPGNRNVRSVPRSAQGQRDVRLAGLLVGEEVRGVDEANS